MRGSASDIITVLWCSASRLCLDSVRKARGRKTSFCCIAIRLRTASFLAIGYRETMNANGSDKSSPSDPLGLLGMGVRLSSVGQLAMATGHGARSNVRKDTPTHGRPMAERTLEERRGDMTNRGNGSPGTGSEERQHGADARHRDGAGTLVSV